METKDLARRIEPTVLDEIARLIRQIRYGEVIITIHDGRVVQIEQREKKRLVS